MTNWGWNGAPRSPQLSLSLGLVLGNRMVQLEWRRHGQTEPQQSHSRELVPPSQYRETSAMNSMRPSQSSKNREMDRLRVQMLALQQGVRHHKGNRDHWEISPDGGDSCRGENTLRYPQLHQESRPHRYRQRSISPPHRNRKSSVFLVNKCKERVDSPPWRNKQKELSPWRIEEREVSLRRF